MTKWSVVVLAVLAAAPFCRAQGLPRPCSLVTPADVEATLGKASTMTPVHNTRTGFDECVLQGTMHGVNRVIMLLHPGADFAASKKAMLESGTDVRAVSGLGEDAFVGRAVGYNVHKGRAWLQVFGALANDDGANDKATRAIAERATSRL